MAVPVKFRYGLYSEYKGLNSHESGTLYFITDRGLIFRGDSLVTQKIDVSTNVDSSNNTYLIITDNEGWENVNTYEVYDRQAILNILQTYMTAADAMHFKGILGTGTGQVSLPTYGYKAGDVYKVGEAGTYAGQYCEVGDMVIAIKDGPASGSVVTASDWTVVQENIDGAVTVPQHDYVLDSSNNSATVTTDFDEFANENSNLKPYYVVYDADGYSGKPESAYLCVEIKESRRFVEQDDRCLLS